MATDRKSKIEDVVLLNASAIRRLEMLQEYLNQVAQNAMLASNLHWHPVPEERGQ